MNVTILRIENCPNWELARDRVRSAAERAGVDLDLDLDIRSVTAGDDAAALGFTGSPTILVEGRNPFGGEVTANLACRTYDTAAGPEGAPSLEAIGAALTDLA